MAELGAIMVDYIGTARLRELMARTGTGRFIEELAGEIEADYRRWDDFEKSPRHAIHSSGGVIELMPTSDGRLYSFKYVNGHPKNTVKHLLTVTAFGVLADVATGYPLLLSEMTFVTALRTAAISALTARRMARPESRVMALIGNGAQSEFQAIAFHHKRNATILTPDMISPGMHLNAVGGDCPGKTELHADILRAKDVRIVVEFEPQARIEGEIQHLVALGEMDALGRVTELADVVRGRVPGRVNDREVTLFDSVGFALNDFSSLRYLQRLNAEQPDGGQRIDLIPELDDPKDLFVGLAQDHAQERGRVRRRRFA